jgi:hypothetical protein
MGMNLQGDLHKWIVTEVLEASGHNTSVHRWKAF